MKIRNSSALSEKDKNKSFFFESFSYLMVNKSDKSQTGKMSGKCVLPSQMATAIWLFLSVT